jgi:hypothetical protein
LSQQQKLIQPIKATESSWHWREEKDKKIIKLLQTFSFVSELFDPSNY